MAGKDINFKFGGSSDELEKMLKRVQNGFGSLEHVAHSVAGAFAFEKIREGFLSFVEESDKADMAANRLSITLGSSGSAGDAAGILEMADALEELTTYEADVTVEAAAMMGRFKLTGDQIKTLIPAAQNMAAVLGKDLVSSSDAMARAVHVGAQGLRALDMGFTANERAAFELADAHGRVEIIARRANATFAGGAAAMASTATGAAMQYANALQQLQQSIGGVLQRPVAAFFQAMTESTRETVAAFDRLSPTARGVMVAMAGGVAGLGAAAAAMVVLASAAGALTPVLGPVILGFATLMHTSISLSGVLGVLRGAFVAVRTAAITAWGGVIAPLLAIGAAVVGVIVFLGSMSRNWAEVKYNAHAAVVAIQGWWHDLVTGMVSKWAVFVDGIVEKFVLIKSMLSGMTPEAAGEAARAAVAESGGASMLAKIAAVGGEAAAKIAGAVGPTLRGVGDTLSTALAVGGEMVSASAADFKKDFGAGVDLLVKGAKSFGLDFEALGTKAKKPKAPGGAGVGAEDIGGTINLKDIFAGIDDTALKNAENKVASNITQAFGSGSAGLAAAGRFMANLESASGLSEQTLTAILTRTGTSVSDLSGVANSMRGMTDTTVNALLRAGGYSVAAIQQVAPALQGTSDATVQALLKASYGSITAVGEVAPHVRGMSDEAIKKFLDLGGSLSGLSAMGDDFRGIRSAMDTATAAASAYWDTFSAKMASLGSKAADAGIHLASGMGAVGSMFGGVMTALGKGDVMGAAIGAVSSLVTQSKSFQGVSKILNDMFTNFAQALNPLFNGLAPILLMIGNLLSAIGGAIKAIFEGIQPIFALIGSILAPVFTIVNSLFGGLKTVFQAIFAPILPLVRGLMPIFKMVGDMFNALAPILIQLFLRTSPLMLALGLVTAIFQALEPVFKVVSQVIGQFINLVLAIFKALAGVWNAIVAFVANAAQQFVALIPGMADAAKKFGDSIRGAAINIGSLDTAMKAVTATANTQADYTFPDLSAAVDGAAGSASKAGAEMGNLPQGFKINLLEFEATTAASADAMREFLELTSGGLGSPDGGVPTVVMGSLPSVASASPAAAQGAPGGGGGAGVTIYVTNPDPAALAAMVKTQLEAKNLQSTGNPNTGGERTYSTPLTSSSFK